MTTDRRSRQAQTLADQFGDGQVPAERVAEVPAKQDVADPYEILLYGASVQSVVAAQVLDFMRLQVFAVLVGLLHQPVDEISRRQDDDEE